MVDQRLAVRVPEIEMPLASAEQAKAMWQDYQALEEAILSDDDYLWLVEWEESETNSRRRKVRRIFSATREEAEKLAGQRSGRVRKRKVKSACRKLARFFGIEVPEVGSQPPQRYQEGDYIVSVERGDFYCITEWMDGNLRTIKASATVFIRSMQTGRTWLGKGGAHHAEGFAEDFAVAQTAFTRSVNRAILDMVGYGDESAEETLSSERLPGDQERERPKESQNLRAAAFARIGEWMKEQGWTKEQIGAEWAKLYPKVAVKQASVLQLNGLLEHLKGLASQQDTEPSFSWTPDVDDENTQMAAGMEEQQRQAYLHGADGDDLPPPILPTAIHSMGQLGQVLTSFDWDLARLEIEVLQMSIDRWTKQGHTLQDAFEAWKIKAGI